MTRIRNEKGQFVRGSFRGRDNYKWVGGKVKSRCRFCKKTLFINPNILKRIRKEEKYPFCSHKCKGLWQKELPPEKGSRWTGGRIKDKGSYVMVHSPTHPFKNSIGYVFEHRLVIEKKIGRYLKQNEYIHHLNGIRGDNREENLIMVNRENHDTMSVRHAMEKRIRELEKRLALCS